MNWQEQVFEAVDPRDGLVRRGILCWPERPTTSTAMILLPAGLKDRVGPHRLYVHLARFLSSHGIPVLRLDALGIGESDGEMAAAFNGFHYRRIQSGQFVDDTLLAMEVLSKRFPIRRFVLAGLCGGAISAQLAAAAAQDRVVGVLSLSHVAVLDDEQPGAARTRSEVVSNSRAYLRKLFSSDAWSRLLSGQSSLASIAGNISGLFSLLMEKAGWGRRHWANENPLFFSSFRDLQQAGIEHLMIFAERDARWTAFNELVIEGMLDGKRQGKCYRVEVIPHANHEFYLPAWSQQLMHLTLSWLTALLRGGDEFARTSVDHDADGMAAGGRLP